MTFASCVIEFVAGTSGLQAKPIWSQKAVSHLRRIYLGMPPWWIKGDWKHRANGSPVRSLGTEPNAQIIEIMPQWLKRTTIKTHFVAGMSLQTIEPFALEVVFAQRSNLVGWQGFAFRLFRVWPPVMFNRHIHVCNHVPNTVDAWCLTYLCLLIYIHNAHVDIYIYIACL